MGKYRKKPIIIEAWEWNGRTLADAKNFCERLSLPKWGVGIRNGETGLIIPTLEGDHLAKQGDYIIKGIAGEFYPCKEEIFHQTYEQIFETNLRSQ